MEDDTTLPTAALRDFSPPNVRYGSKADKAALRRHVRFAPKSGQSGDMLARPLCAKSVPTRCTRAPLFDHLVGVSEQPVRHVEVECPGCLEVEHELEFGRLHYRQVGRLFALENAPGIDAGLAIGIGDAGSIADQPALESEFAQRIHGGNGMARG